MAGEIVEIIGAVIDVEFPNLLPHVRKRSKELGCLATIVDASERVEGTIGIHADPLFVRKLSLQVPAVAFELPTIEPGNRRDGPRHERGEEAPSEDLPQKHDFNVVVDRVSVVQHHGERASRSQDPVHLPDDPFRCGRVMNHAKAVHMVDACIG